MKVTRGHYPTIRSARADKIMLVGGYGGVGKLAARQLARHYPNRLVITGRNFDRADNAAREVGHGTQARRIELGSAIPADVLDGVGVVLVCLEQNDSRFAERCLASGIHYLDVSADFGFLKQIEALDSVARKSGSSVVLSVGLSPGLTNLMAVQATQMLDDVARIDIFLQLGLGERHGRASIEWLVDNFDALFSVYEGGRARGVRSFAKSKKIRFPREAWGRRAYHFPFSDQITLGNAFRIPSISTWLCFDSRVVTTLFAVLARARLGRLLRRDPWRRWAVAVLGGLRSGSDRFVVSVRARGTVSGRTSLVEIDVGGRTEASMTALIAAETVRLVVEDKPPPGVHHIEQVMDIGFVAPALKREISAFFASASSGPRVEKSDAFAA